MIADAVKEIEIEADGFTAVIKGEGSKVIQQIPAVSSKVSKGGSIVLYTDEASKTDTVMVPSFLNYLASEANAVASDYGLNVSFKGAVSAGGTCTAQDIKEGESVPPGTVITLTFSANTDAGFAD